MEIVILTGMSGAGRSAFTAGAWSAPARRKRTAVWRIDSIRA